MSAPTNTALSKYHGLGNDFIVLDGLERGIFLSKEDAAALCDRHTGVGGDGVIWVLKGGESPFRMHIHNADGSEPEMCGNGVRVFAHYLADQGLVKTGDAVAVDTPGGKVVVHLLSHDGADALVKVDMGPPRLAPGEIPVAVDQAPPVLDLPVAVDGVTYRFNAVSMGNPHAITFVDAITDELVHGVGPRVEKHPLFPAKTNVEFIQVVSDGEVNMRVWERGVGETQACGTGACASAVAAILQGHTGEQVRVNLPGGPLDIDWTGRGTVFMTGPSRRVCSTGSRPARACWPGQQSLQTAQRTLPQQAPG